MSAKEIGNDRQDAARALARDLGRRAARGGGVVTASAAAASSEWEAVGDVAARVVAGAGSVTFSVPGDPTPFSWAQRGAQRFTPPRQKSAMHTIGMCARVAMRGRAMLTGPLILEAVFVRTRKARTKADVGTWADTARPDLTNLVKLLEDSLTGIVWGDDAQVTEHRARKLVTTHPDRRAETIITIRRAS